MKRAYCLGILGCLVIAELAWGSDATKTGPDPTQGDAQANPPAGTGKAAASPNAKAAEESKVLAAVREALERNAQEIKALKEQYARDMAEQRKEVEAQRKKVEAQQKQIETLTRSSQLLQEQLRTAQGADRQQKLSAVQQQQIRLMEEQSKLAADQLEKLQPQTATLEGRSKQAALRDRELGDATDGLRDMVDDLRRNPPWLPNQLKELFLPSGTNVTPISMFNTLAANYHVFPSQKGAGHFEFEEYTPFFLVQLNKRFLLSAEVTFSPGGASLGQAQIDAFINDWLTADIGYFLAPTGFMNERLDPSWIIKTPDLPLSMLQVMPDGLTLMGLQFRGARYLFGSPVKMEYSTWVTNGLGVPGQGQAADWYDLGGVVGTSGNVNNALAYGGRIGFWIPARGINFGVSEFVNAPYTHQSGAVMSVWQPYFNYHRGNWDFRFEYGDNYERTKPFIGNNIDRRGFYTQIAYRNYRSLKKHIQRLEYVFRYSEARFHGIDQKSLFASPLDPPQSTPVDANQYTLGINYYFYPSTVVKLAYEFNQTLRQSLHDNELIIQFATNF
jgi:hypothetical protein